MSDIANMVVTTTDQTRALRTVVEELSGTLDADRPDLAALQNDINDLYDAADALRSQAAKLVAEARIIRDLRQIAPTPAEQLLVVAADLLAMWKTSEGQVLYDRGSGDDYPEFNAQCDRYDTMLRVLTRQIQAAPQGRE